jgi:hypothetical protein
MRKIVHLGRRLSRKGNTDGSLDENSHNCVDRAKRRGSWRRLAIDN